MTALFHLEARRAESVNDADWFVTTITALSYEEVNRVLPFMNAGVEFVYRAVPVDGQEPVVKLLLDRSAVRVVKAALLVEIATLEFKAREDHQPDVWLPPAISLLWMCMFLTGRYLKRLPVHLLLELMT